MVVHDLNPLLPHLDGAVYLLQQLERGVLDGVEPSGWRAFTAHTLKLGALQRMKGEWRQLRWREAVAGPLRVLLSLGAVRTA